MVDARASTASFRDPSGFVFRRDNVLYRQINLGFEDGLSLLMDSGLHDELSRAGKVVDFDVVDLSLSATPVAALVIKPKPIRFISYPFEWSFSQLKDAALLTLELMKSSLAKGMILKDASAYNIQFVGSNAVFIDTLSFERYKEGEPWVAYKQFCEHFLAPLALMSTVDVRLNSLLQTHLDGIPLDLASRLLPAKTKLSPGLLTHIHMHARAQASSGKPVRSANSPTVSKTGVLALIDSLHSTISRLTWEPTGTEWGDYYSATNYTEESFSEKGTVVKRFLDMLPATVKTCCDLGANNGEFSQLAVGKQLETVALDIDPAAVEKCYLHSKKATSGSLLPLLQDLRNPTSDFGWGGSERDSLVERFSGDVILALALIHHLAIGNNVPLSMVAEYFSKLGEWLIIEFVPKEDSQVQRMLVAREDIFADYHQDGFEAAFSQRFKIVTQQSITGTARTVYLMQRNR